MGDSIVCKTKLAFGMAAAAMMTAAIFISGCSDSTPRRAGRELRREIDKAQRLCNRAMTLMKNVVIRDKDTKETSPLSREVTDPGAIDVLKPTEAVNPKAIVSLDKAVLILDAAIGRHGGTAEAVDVGLAYLQLARVHALRAHYQRAAASVAHFKVEQFTQDVKQAAEGLRAKAALVQYYNLLAGAKNEQAQERFDIEKQKARRATDELKKINGQIADLETDKEAQVKLENDCTVEARALRMRSREPGLKDPMAQLEKALAKRLEVNKAAAKIAGIEHEIDVRKTRRGTLALELALANSIQSAMKAILDIEDDSVAESGSKRDETRAAIVAEAKNAENDANDLKGACKEAGQHEELAEECLRKAVEACRQAAPRLGGPPADETAAQRGDTHMAWADLNTSRLRRRRRISQFADAMMSLWGKLDRPGDAAAAFSEMAASYLAKPAEVKKQAETQYQQAVESYAAALSELGSRPKRRWAYQGQLATAYIGLYRLTGDADKRDKARDLLNKALEDRESSPYLKSLLWFHRQLQR